MKIASTQYTTATKSLEIYLAGCDGSCKECHNPELWDFELGDNYEEKIEAIKAKIKKFDRLIDWIWILGGEPLLQDHKKLIHLMREIRAAGKPILLMTRFNDIPREISRECDFIKTGEYIPELAGTGREYYGIQLATGNQKIEKIR